MENKKLIYTLLGVIIFLTIVLTTSILHNFETHAHVRCDGKPIFPIAPNDTIHDGNMKLDNAILTHFGARIRLHEPTDDKATYNVFHKGCIYHSSGWRYR